MLVSLPVPTFITKIAAAFLNVKNTEPSQITKVWLEQDWEVRRFDFSKKTIWEYKKTKPWGRANIYFVKKSTKPYHQVDSYVINIVNEELVKDTVIVGRSYRRFLTLIEGREWFDSMLIKDLESLGLQDN